MHIVTCMDYGNAKSIYIYIKVTEQHNDEVEDQDEQIMGILKYLTEWLVNHILYANGQIPKG